MAPTDTALTAHSICFAYDRQDVLHDVSVQLFRGEVVAIAGANGAGKSTLLEILAGTRTPSSGRVIRHGDLALAVQRPTAPPSLPLTAADTVAIGTWKRGTRMSASSRRAAVTDALGRVGMADHASRPLTALSGGQRQRVFLAQGIVRRPDILLLDEPAAGLDRESIDRTQQILAEEAARGAAVACVTHHDAAIASADRVILLDRGTLVPEQATLDGW
ncbi:ATP-binding cassette domain-containing protein [Microbacterium esteraromaticum]|uniref:metal ABC transporter ATP-binding protein n=1 Tax=Microbacterium esteraromaticum TaxID=57043 RepID=UPI0023688E81|nr:ATP-binding cassette domain-containing protein [Microbacterium esteraromaticum]WDH79319.1 ATP-binding cassette domain-containing protein [Microbacterium esteraromaticum]